jgi:cell division protease FtsH
MTFGGRVAEELVFGREHVTTGASSDIKQATGIARRYVTQWGLSDEIGPILVGDNEQDLFLGRDIQHRREVSEKTAQTVDAEVKKVIDEAYRRAKVVLTENLALLHMVASQLLERETLTGEEVAALARGEVLAPRSPSEPPPLPPAPAKPVAEPRRAPPLLGGPEIAPA